MRLKNKHRRIALFMTRLKHSQRTTHHRSFVFLQGYKERSGIATTVFGKRKEDAYFYQRLMGASVYDGTYERLGPSSQAPELRDLRSILPSDRVRRTIIGLASHQNFSNLKAEHHHRTPSQSAIHLCSYNMHWHFSSVFYRRLSLKLI